jgi:uncharacterized protein
MRQRIVVKTPKMPLTQPPIATKLSQKPLPAFQFRQVTFEWPDKNITNWFNGIVGSTFFTTDDKIRYKKEVADVFFVALRKNGLPLAVILDGCGPDAERKVIKRIGRSVLELLSATLTNIEGKTLSIDTIRQQLRQDFLKLNNALSHTVEWEASLSASGLYYDAKQQLQLLSIGIGDTLVALAKDFQIETIIPAILQVTLEEDGTETLAPIPLPAPRNRSLTPHKVQANLVIDLRPAHPGERLLFFSDGAYQHLACIERRVQRDDGSFVVETRLKSDAFSAKLSPVALTQFAVAATNQRIQAAKEGECFSIGDDVCVGECVIPTAAQADAFQPHVVSFLKLQDSKTLLIKHREYLDSLKETLESPSGDIKRVAAQTLIRLEDTLKNWLTSFVKDGQELLAELFKFCEQCRLGLVNSSQTADWSSILAEIEDIHRAFTQFLDGINELMTIKKTIKRYLQRDLTPAEQRVFAMITSRLKKKYKDQLTTVHESTLGQGIADLLLHYGKLIHSMDVGSLDRFSEQLVKRLLIYMFEQRKGLIPYEREQWFEAVYEGEADSFDILEPDIKVRVATQIYTVSISLTKAFKRIWPNLLVDTDNITLFEEATQIASFWGDPTKKYEHVHGLFKNLQLKAVILLGNVQHNPMSAEHHVRGHIEAGHRLTRGQLEAYLKSLHAGEISMELSLLRYIQTKYYRYVQFPQGLVVDGSGLDLRGLNLRNADLRGCLFIESDFRFATLQDADIRGVSLRKANLEGALLQGVKCDDADFTDAKMTQAIGIPKTKISLHSNPELRLQQWIAVIKGFITAFAQEPLSDQEKIQLFPYLANIHLKKISHVKALDAHPELQGRLLERSLEIKEGIFHCTYPDKLKLEKYPVLFAAIKTRTLYEGFFEILHEALSFSLRLLQNEALVDASWKLKLYELHHGLVVAYMSQIASYWHFTLSHCNDMHQQKAFLQPALANYAAALEKYELARDKWLQVDLSETWICQGLDVRGWDLSLLKLNVDQLAKMIGFSQAHGVDPLQCKEAIARKIQMLQQLLQQKSHLIQQVDRWADALQYMPLLVCQGVYPDLEKIPTGMLKPLTYSLLTSSQLNILDDAHPQSFVQIAKRDYKEVWERNDKAFRCDLTDILCAHKNTLTPLNLAQQHCSRLSRYHIDVDDTGLTLSDVEKRLLDLPEEAVRQLRQQLDEVRAQRKQCKLALEQHSKEAEKVYLQCLVNILHDAHTLSQDRQEALEEIFTYMDGQLHLELDLRKAYLEDVDFKKIRLPLQVNVYLHPTHFQKYLTPAQKETCWQAFIKAILKGDLLSVQRWVKRGIDINTVSVDKRTALMDACYEGEVEIARYLLAQGADVTPRSSSGLTCIDTACMLREAGTLRNQKEIIALLKKHYVKSFSLHHYVALGEFKQVKQVLTRENVNETHPYRDLTPLHVAVLNKQYHCAALLLYYGADLNKVDSSQQTPFEMACLEGHLPLVKLLWNKQALNRLNSPSGQHLFYQVIKKGYETVAKQLVDYGANLTDKEAVIMDHRPRIEHLLAKQPPYCDEEGNSLLHLALLHGKETLALWLIDKGGKSFVPNKKGEYPLPLAARQGCLQVVEALVKLKTPVESQEYTLSPLLEAVHRGHIAIVQFLLKSNANPNASHPQLGYTALQKATRRQDIPMVKLLCEKGAAFSIDKEGNTLLHEAAEKGNEELVAYFCDQLLSFQNYAQQTVLDKFPASLRSLWSAKRQLMPATVLVEPYIQSSATAATEDLKAKTLAAPPSYQAQMLSTATKVTLELSSEPWSIHSGFNVFATTRSAVAEVLKSLAEQKATQEQLEADIRYAFGQEWLKTSQQQLLQNGLVRAQDALVKLNDKIKREYPKLSSSLPAGKALVEFLKGQGDEANRQALHQCQEDIISAEEVLSSYYQQKAVILAYARTFEQPLIPMGYGTAFVYARARGISLSVWEAKGESDTLTLRHCHDEGEFAGPMRHLLLRGETPFFDELICIEALKLKSDLSVTSLATSSLSETLNIEPPQPKFKHPEIKNTEWRRHYAALFHWCKIFPEMVLELKTGQYVTLDEIYRSIQTPDAWYSNDYLDTLMAALPPVAQVKCYPAISISELGARLEKVATQTAPFALYLVNKHYNDPNETVLLNHWVVLLLNKDARQIYCLDPAKNVVDDLIIRIASALHWDDNFVSLKNPIDFQAAEKDERVGTRHCGPYAIEIAKCLLEGIEAQRLPCKLVEHETLEASLASCLHPMTYGDCLSVLVLRERHLRLAYDYLYESYKQVILGRWFTANEGLIPQSNKEAEKIYGGSTQFLWTKLDLRTRAALACVDKNGLGFFKALGTETQEYQSKLELGKTFSKSKWLVHVITTNYNLLEFNQGHTVLVVEGVKSYGQVCNGVYSSRFAVFRGQYDITYTRYSNSGIIPKGYVDKVRIYEDDDFSLDKLAVYRQNGIHLCFDNLVVENVIKMIDSIKEDAKKTLELQEKIITKVKPHEEINKQYIETNGYIHYEFLTDNCAHWCIKKLDIAGCDTQNMFPKPVKLTKV